MRIMGVCICMCFQFQGLVVAAFSDLLRPPEKLSEKQSGALMATGLIWSRYSLVIKPKNWNLFSVNMFVAISNGIQLFRIYQCVCSPTASCEHLLCNTLLLCGSGIASVITHIHTTSVVVSLAQYTYCLCHFGSVSCTIYYCFVGVGLLLSSHIYTPLPS